MRWRQPGGRTLSRVPRDSVHDALTAVAEASAPLARAFAAAGHSLYAVGGAVRDALLGEPVAGTAEVDFTTDARPDEVKAILAPLCSALWEQGRAFGTIGGTLAATGLDVEVTTFRSEAYVDHSRKPAVEWGDSLEVDLSRRDFTINALALDVIALVEGAEGVQTLFDYFGGFADLVERRLRTPTDPERLFADDPLRMLRAARFAARLALVIDPAIEAATAAMAGRLEKVSAERVRGELDLLMVAPFPSVGLDFIVRTGLAEHFLPELPALRLEQDPIHHHKDVLRHTLAVVDKASPRLRLRLAALFHDVGKPATREISDEGVTFRFHEVVGAKMTRRRMAALKYPQDLIDEVAELVELHLRFHTYKLGWTDSAVRRYVRDAGDMLEDLNELTRCDCTTRNLKKATELARVMDELEERIDELAALEELAAMRPALDGHEVMALLDLAPGPAVGRALDFLMDIRLDEGEIAPAEAAARLTQWWAAQRASA